jgi:hypothetical protein
VATERTTIPLTPDALKHPDNIQAVNASLASTALISPIANKRVGQAAPPDKFLRAGLLAYADGTNWDPVSAGAPSFVMYNGAAWASLASTPATEGTFTPTILGSVTAGTQTYSFQTGWYSKVGDVCFIALNVKLTALDGSTAGNMQVGGLPYSGKNLTHLNQSLNISNYSNCGMDAGYAELGAQVVPSSSVIAIFEKGSGIAAQALPAANLSATTQFTISGFYFV